MFLDAVALPPIVGILLSPSVINLAILGLGALIAHTIRKPKDLERAQHLDTIARGAAALVLSLNPDKPWARLLEDTVKQISAAAGLPTQNGKAIERAAAGALAGLGVKPA